MIQWFFQRQLRPACVGLLVLSGAPVAQAAGFQINEISASGLGTASAGGAAEAPDASTVWSNVAGLSRLGQSQVSGTLHLIRRPATGRAEAQPGHTTGREHDHREVLRQYPSIGRSGGRVPQVQYRLEWPAARCCPARWRRRSRRSDEEHVRCG